MVDLTFVYNGYKIYRSMTGLKMEEKGKVFLKKSKLKCNAWFLKNRHMLLRLIFIHMWWGYERFCHKKYIMLELYDGTQMVLVVDSLEADPETRIQVQVVK